MSRAIVVEETGGIDVLRWRDSDPGAPGPGHVRVTTSAAGVNFIDIYFRTGAYPIPLPYRAGLEGSGRVESVGPGVTAFAAGDRVAWSRVPGSYAQAVVAPAEALVKVPDAVPDDIAAAAMLQGMTAHYLTHALREPHAGDSALVHAAAGGTGLLLVQMLTGLGVRVIGTCSTAEKEALARGAGCAEVVRYRDADFVEATRSFTQGRGVDVVYDSVGKTTFDGSLECLRPRGLLALFGQASGAVPPFDLQRLNGAGSLVVTRPSLAHFVATREEFEMRAGAVLGGIASGDLHVRIGARFPLAEAGAAHAALAGRETTGKVLLTP